VIYWILFKNRLHFDLVENLKSKNLSYYLKSNVAKIIIFFPFLISISVSSAKSDALSGIGLSYKHGCLEKAAWMASADKRELHCHCVATAFVYLKGDLDILHWSIARVGLTKYGTESDLKHIIDQKSSRALQMCPSVL